MSSPITEEKSNLDCSADERSETIEPAAVVGEQNDDCSEALKLDMHAIGMASDSAKEKTCHCFCDDVSPATQSQHHVGMNIKQLPNALFESILDDSSNRHCVDCNVFNPDWASIGFGTLLCLTCAGRHRSFGTHVTLVRSITMDDWSDEQLSYIKLGGNRAFQEYASQCDVQALNKQQERYYDPKINYYRLRNINVSISIILIYLFVSAEKSSVQKCKGGRFHRMTKQSGRLNPLQNQQDYRIKNRTGFRMKIAQIVCFATRHSLSSLEGIIAGDVVNVYVQIVHLQKIRDLFMNFL
jgi:hypothetical protein